MSKIKQNISFIILTLANLAYFFFSSVSAYKPSTLYIKLILGLILVTAIVSDVKLIKINSFINTKILFNPANKALFLVFLFFILNIVVSIIYSSDKPYGLFKIINLVSNLSFITLANLYYLNRLNNETCKIPVIITVSIAIITLIAAIIINPFHYGAVKEIGFYYWGHIQYSSFLALTFFMLIYFWDKTAITDKPKIIIYNLLFSILILGIYYTALRSSIIGMFVACLLLFITYLFSKTPLHRRLTLLFAVILPLLLLYIEPFGEGKTSVRYSNLLQVEEMNFNDDAPIRTRLSAYKESIDIINNNLPFGTGFGGYRNQSELAEYINYPHNIFLETLIELGIPGILLLVLLLIMILIKFTLKMPILLSFFIYALTLSFFAKDIPNQSFLFLIIALVLHKNSK